MYQQTGGDPFGQGMGRLQPLARAGGGRSYVAMGGTLTSGRFIDLPWPNLLHQHTGRKVINLAIPAAGPDLYVQDTDLVHIAGCAERRFIELPGAVGISNPFYRVHPRRNDRVVMISPRLQDLYPKLDLLGHCFTGGLVAALAQEPALFERVVRGLSQAWVKQMRRLLAMFTGPSYLLWLANRPLGQGSLEAGAPPLVDRRMVAALISPQVRLIEVVLPEYLGSTEGKRFEIQHRQAARLLPGPLGHQRICDQIAAHLAAERNRAPFLAP